MATTKQTETEAAPRYTNVVAEILAAGGDVLHDLLEAVACRTATVTDAKDAVQLLTSGGGDPQALLQLITTAVNVLVDDKLNNLGPVIQAAVQSNASKLGDRLTLNNATGADGTVTIETNNLTSAQWKVDLDVVTQRGGVLSVNGKKVLTADDQNGGPIASPLPISTPGNAVDIRAEGTRDNLDIRLLTKGYGTAFVNDDRIITEEMPQSLYDKTLINPRIIGPMGGRIKDADGVDIVGFGAAGTTADRFLLFLNARSSANEKPTIVAISPAGYAKGGVNVDAEEGLFVNGSRVLTNGDAGSPDQLRAPAKLVSDTTTPFSDVDFAVDSTRNLPLNLNLVSPGGVVKANGDPLALAKDVPNADQIGQTAASALGLAATFEAPRIIDPRIRGEIRGMDSGARVLRFIDTSNDARFLSITAAGELGQPQISVEASNGNTLNGDLVLRPKGQGAVVIGTPVSSATVRADGQLDDINLALQPKGSGQVMINGSRVLTTADALTAGGSGIDQAAVEAAVAAATAPLLARIDALEAGLAALADKQQADADALAGLINDAGDASTAVVEQLTASIVVELDKKTNQTDHQAFLDAFTMRPAGQGTVAAVTEFMQRLGTEIAGFMTNGQLLTDVLSKFGDTGGLEAVDSFLSELNTFAEDTTARVTDLEGAATRTATTVQTVIDAIGGRPNAPVSDVANWRNGIEAWVVDHEQANAQTFNDIVEYVITEHATKAEVQAVTDQVAACAKLNDPTQILTAKSLTIDGLRFGNGGGVLTYFDDEYGNRLRLFEANITNPADAGIVVVHTDILEILGPADAPKLFAERKESP